MKEIKKLEELLETIKSTELEREEHFNDLKEHFSATYKKINFENIMSDSIRNIISKPIVTGNLINSVFSFLGGYLSKKIIIGKSTNIFKNILGSVVQYGFTSFGYQKPEIINTIRLVIENLFTTKEEKKQA
jgi:uncharacterized Fe-S center protein